MESEEARDGRKRDDAAAPDGGSERHVPVLVEETFAYLEPERGGTYVDCTLGLGGHAERLLERAPRARLVGIDRDPEALEIARRRLERFGDRVELVQGDFRDLEELLDEIDVASVAGIYADLGVSSLQLDKAERGFSFRAEGPLDMRMGPDAPCTAREIVNEYPEETLETILRQYGEERRARRIARAIVERRREAPIETTRELRELVAGVIGKSGRKSRIDPATRTFQALRIEVNRELSGLRKFLDQALRMLDTDGRLIVISYHSLEDRIVKNALRVSALGEVDPVTGRPRSETQLIELLTRKPVRPSPAEVSFNPRSRSARLRAARRL